jgi:putative chitinase
MADFTFNFTPDKLAACLPGNPYIEHWHEALCKILPDYDISTPQRVGAFLAQTAHESGGYKALKENLNYRAETLMKVWPHYFPNMDVANHYAHNQEAIANRAYAGRMGNGDEASGDGWSYCGRGLIQLTGKNNYQSFADSIQTDISQIPAYLQTFEGAIQSACWFWENNNLNACADAGDIVKMTKIINGGELGLDDRTARYNHALQVLGS